MAGILLNEVNLCLGVGGPFDFCISSGVVCRDHICIYIVIRTLCVWCFSV